MTVQLAIVVLIIAVAVSVSLRALLHTLRNKDNECTNCQIKGNCSCCNNHCHSRSDKMHNFDR